MKKRGWPWIAFGAALVFAVLPSWVPPPDPYATFASLGRPITVDQFDEAKRMTADWDHGIMAARSPFVLQAFFGEPPERIRAWALPMSVAEARKRLVESGFPVRPSMAENVRAGYPHGARDYLCWYYHSPENYAAAGVLESTVLPKPYGCAVIVAESGGPARAWDRIVWRLKGRLGMK